MTSHSDIVARTEDELPVGTLPDYFAQVIHWTRTEARRPHASGRYRIRNEKGYESIGHYFEEDDQTDAGWVTADFDGKIEYWAVLYVK